MKLTKGWKYRAIKDNEFFREKIRKMFADNPCNKRIYERKKDAETKLNFLNKTKGKFLTGIYFCEKCGGWHITSKNVYERHYKNRTFIRK